MNIDIDNFKTIECTDLNKKYEEADINIQSIKFELPKKYLITGINGAGKCFLKTYNEIWKIGLRRNFL